MAYTAKSITAANCVFYIVQNLESDMSNVGFVQVTTGNVQNSLANIATIWDWWESPAANNAIGQNWYVGIGRDQASQTNVYFSICAFMPNTSNSNTVISGFPPIATSMPASNSQNCLASSQTANACNNSGNVNVFGYTGTLPTAGSGALFTYSCLIDRIIFNVGSGATLSNNTTLYVGTYDSFMPLTVDPYPLIVANLNSIVLGLGSSGASLSEPANTTTAASNFEVGLNNWSLMAAGLDPYLGGGGTNPARYPTSRMAVLGRTASLSVVGFGYRGLLKDVLFTPPLTTAPQRGDTISFTFNGTVYTYTYLGTASAGPCYFTSGYNSSTVQGFGPYVNQI